MYDFSETQLVLRELHPVVYQGKPALVIVTHLCLVRRAPAQDPHGLCSRPCPGLVPPPPPSPGRSPHQAAAST